MLGASLAIIGEEAAYEGKPTTVDTSYAAHVHALGQRVQHFSPEPRVIAKLIGSATLVGRDEPFAQARRFSSAFPREYAR